VQRKAKERKYVVSLKLSIERTHLIDSGRLFHSFGATAKTRCPILANLHWGAGQSSF